MRLPYANLRTHRKLLLVDGEVGFAGGMNVRAAFSETNNQPALAQDTHFRFEGPVISQLFRVFAGDWWFTTGERLKGRQWAHQRKPSSGSTLCRPIDSGPDDGLERAHNLILGALSVAQTRIRIQTPYFLPDGRLVSALAVAARRGVEVDIVIPEHSNLRLIDWAVNAQLDQVIAPGCRVWRTSGRFDHSKLMVVDGSWALVGSSNLDARSLRLNFELDIEIMDRVVATGIDRAIEKRMKGARHETLAALKARPYPVRLRNRALWLFSPYL
jgi:cardiolipin synthase